LRTATCSHEPRRAQKTRELAGSNCKWLLCRLSLTMQSQMGLNPCDKALSHSHLDRPTVLGNWSSVGLAIERRLRRLHPASVHQGQSPTNLGRMTYFPVISALLGIAQSEGNSQKGVMRKRRPEGRRTGMLWGAQRTDIHTQTQYYVYALEVMHENAQRHRTTSSCHL
jgi:hypothetical protein